MLSHLLPDSFTWVIFIVISDRIMCAPLDWIMWVRENREGTFSGTGNAWLAIGREFPFYIKLDTFGGFQIVRKVATFSLRPIFQLLEAWWSRNIFWRRCSSASGRSAFQTEPCLSKSTFIWWNDFRGYWANQSTEYPYIEIPDHFAIIDSLDTLMFYFLVHSYPIFRKKRNVKTHKQHRIHQLLFLLKVIWRFIYRIVYPKMFYFRKAGIPNNLMRIWISKEPYPSYMNFSKSISLRKGFWLSEFWLFPERNDNF